jgi:uncharacterized protein (TIGR02265 family)
MAAIQVGHGSAAAPRKVEEALAASGEAGKPPTSEWVADFERRLSLARPEDTVRGMFFNTALKAIESMGGEALAKRCAQSTGQESYVEFFSYPIELFLRLVLTALPELAERHGGCEEVLRLLGRRSAEVFMNSVAGRALRLLAQGDARRLVGNLPGGFKVAASFGSHEVVWTGPKSGRFTLRRDFMPYPFHEGVLLSLIEQGKSQNAQAKCRSLGPLDCECEFSWE